MEQHIVFRKVWVSINQGNPKGGLANGGLARKAPIGPKRALSGAISPLPPWRWGAEESVPIGPEKAPDRPAKKDPISPEKARFPREDFPPIFSENLGLKPPFCEPPFRFSQKILVQIWFHPPPPKRAQNEDKLYKSVQNPQN